MTWHIIKVFDSRQGIPAGKEAVIMPRKKEIMVSRVGGSKSKAEVFEELIWIVLGERVKLAPAPHKGQGQMIEGRTRP